MQKVLQKTKKVTKIKEALDKSQMLIFIDSSAFVMLLDADNLKHIEAVDKLEKISDIARIITSSSAISDTLNTVSKTFNKKDAKDYYMNVLSQIETIFVDIGVYNLSLDLFMRLPFKQVPFNDCTNFVICKEQKVDKVFTFNRRFKERGFKLL